MRTVMGISRSSTSVSLMPSAKPQDLTEHAPVGSMETPMYVAPEVVRGRRGWAAPQTSTHLA